MEARFGPSPGIVAHLIMNRELNSLQCKDEEEYKQEVTQRKHELKGHLEVQRMEEDKGLSQGENDPNSESFKNSGGSGCGKKVGTGS